MNPIKVDIRLQWWHISTIYITLYLVEICQLSNLVPQVSHDLLVLLESGIVPLTLALNDGVANGQAFEVVLVQGAVAVNVVHVPHDELDAVIPGVSYCSVERYRKQVTH